MPCGTNGHAGRAFGSRGACPAKAGGSDCVSTRGWGRRPLLRGPVGGGICPAMPHGMENGQRDGPAPSRAAPYSMNLTGCGRIPGRVRNGKTAFERAPERGKEREDEALYHGPYGVATGFRGGLPEGVAPGRIGKRWGVLRFLRDIVARGVDRAVRRP